MSSKPKHGRKAEDDANEGAKSKRGKRAKVEGAKEKQTEKEDQKDIEWTSKLSFTLIACITENEDLKNGLYPGPGANVSTAKGGGLTKIEHQFKLFSMVFGDEPEWKPVIETAQTPQKKGAATKTRANLASKIKNRLNKMAKQTREITTKLGQTGAGIENASEIDMSRENTFTNVWAKEREKCPWYFEMRNLIGDRPNMKPVGIGNSQSTIDMTVLDVSHKESTPAEGEENDEIELDDDDGPAHKSTPTTDDEDLYGSSKYSQGSDDDSGSKLRAKSSPHHISSDDDPKPRQPHPTSSVSKRKTAPRAAASTAIKLDDKKPVKKSKNDEFAEIAKEEEKTAQRELELAKIRTQLEVEQTKGLAEYRMAREKRRAEEKMKKMEVKEKERERRHEVRMALLNQRVGSGASGGMNSVHNPFNTTPTTPGASSSSASRSEWEDYATNFDFSDMNT